MMEAMTLKEIQSATKELLQEFDELCHTLNIKYFLLYGSLLGAVRHHGFIPWDDDMDVGMTKQDYDVLMLYFENSKDIDIELHTPQNQKDCFYNIARICDKKHRLVFENKAYTSGIFIDIYILEGLGNEDDQPYWERRFKKYRSWQKGIFMNSNNSILYGNNNLHKILNIPKCLKSKLLGKNHYMKLLNSYKYFALENSKYAGVPCWETSRYEKKWFDKLIRTDFEDIEVWIPEKYDEMLTAEYGDYMQLPPDCDRVPHHGYTAYRL